MNTMNDKRTVSSPLAFALLYVVLSMVTEIVLLVVFRLQIPRDTRVIAPIVLTVPPALAAWAGGYRRPNSFWPAALLLAALTLVITLAFNRLTGIKTGVTEPLVTRSMAGLLTALIVNRRLARTLALPASHPPR